MWYLKLFSSDCLSYSDSPDSLSSSLSDSTSNVLETERSNTATLLVPGAIVYLRFMLIVCACFSSLIRRVFWMLKRFESELSFDLLLPMGDLLVFKELRSRSGVESGISALLFLTKAS